MPTATGSTTVTSRQQPDRSAHMVFSDPSGRRLWRTLALLTLIVTTFGVLALWIGPPDYEPPPKGPLNQQQDFARLITGNTDKPLPVIGDTTNGVLNRIVQMRPRPKNKRKADLYDPFTGAKLREAAPWEIDMVGDSEYATEDFGILPPKTLVLTFDDGPSGDYTPQVLDLLKERGIKATFFVIGENVEQHADVLRRVRDEGHLIANHTQNHHIDLNDASQDDVRWQLTQADEEIQKATSYTTTIWRLPEGDAERKPLANARAQQLGYTHVGYTFDPKDWKPKNGEYIPLPKLDGSGEVVLLHDSAGHHPNRLDLLERLIDDAGAKGYRFAPLTTILPPTHIPRNNEQPLNNLLASAAPPLIEDGFHRTMKIINTVIIGSFLAVSVLHLTLASVGYRRHKRRQWPDEQSWPDVSVLLPAFDEEVGIRATLDSLRASIFKRFEVVAVDDGSTDGTLAILRQYAEEFQDTFRLVVLTQQNQGKPAALNKALRHARNKVVITVDGDSLVEPDTLGKLARNFATGRKIGVVCGRVRVGNLQGLWTWLQNIEYQVGICVIRLAESTVDAIMIAPGACAALDKDAVLHAGGFSNATLAEDADLTLRLHQLGYKVVQDYEAAVRTEAPSTLGQLWKQRKRWALGIMQVFWLHRRMLRSLRPIGLSMAFAIFSLLASLVFAPVVMVMAVLQVARGEYGGALTVLGIVTAVYCCEMALALLMLGGKPHHLLAVLPYAPFQKLMQFLLLGYCIITAVYGRGRGFGWNKLQRTGDLVDDIPEVPEAEATAPVGATR